MARIRTVKPEFWSSEQIMSVSRNSRLLFIGLWNFADDCGRLADSAKSIKAQIFPGDDDLNSENVRGMLDELSSNGLLLKYEVNGKSYIEITGWKHQKIDRPQPPKHPPPDSTNARRSFATDLTLSNPTYPRREGWGPKARSLASALPSGALAREPGSVQTAKKPSELSRTELESQFAAKRVAPS
jgi:hypothetical protein